MEYKAMLPTPRKPVALLKSTTGSKNLKVLFLKSSIIFKGLGFIKMLLKRYYIFFVQPKVNLNVTLILAGWKQHILVNLRKTTLQ